MISQEAFWKLEEHGRKAQAVFDEAEMELKKLNYGLVVRRSQEAFELFLKVMFELAEKEYRYEHNLRVEIYADALQSRFKFSNLKIAQMVKENDTLALWRERALYGDQKLKEPQIFVEEEAKLAFQYVRDISSTYEIAKQTIWNELIR